MAGEITRTRARLAVALLFGVNFLNYIDRYVISAVGPLIQSEFHLSDGDLGLILSMFMVAYMVASPLAGGLADRYPRRYFVGSGVLLWSLATIASGLSWSFRQLLWARSFIGVGEAGFGGVAPTLISDLFPKEKRGSALAFFYVAIPAGSALGFVLGGFIGEHYGWRHACFLAGAPGLILGALAFRMPEPARGAGDGVSRAEHTFDWKAALHLAKVPTFVFTTLGMAAMTFALGGLANFVPLFFHRERGLPVGRAGLLFGAMTFVAGLVGTFGGGWLGDRLQKRTPRAYLLVSGWGMLMGVPAAYVGLTATRPGVYLPAIFVAEVMVFLNTGPGNAVLVNVTLPEVRAAAIGMSIFVFHLLGDVPSPILIGHLSDWTGSLSFAMRTTTVAMGIAGILYLIGARTLEEDTQRVLSAVAEREAVGG